MNDYQKIHQNIVGDEVLFEGEGQNSIIQKGTGAVASGNGAVATGYNTLASGDYSHAEGDNTVAQSNAEHAEGRYNVSNKKTDGTSEENKAGTTRHSVGIGDSTNARKNAFEIMQNGDAYVYGVGGYDGTNANGSGVQTLQQSIGGGSTPSVNFCWTTKRKLALEGEGFSSWDEAEEEIGLNEELFNAMLNNPFIVKTNSSIDDTLIILPLVSVTGCITPPIPPGSEPTQKEVYIRFSDSGEDDRKTIVLVFSFFLSTGELNDIWINISSNM